MPKNILIIDDDKAIRDSFCLALEDYPFNVDTAESGERGLEKEKKSHFDLIFLDLKMPGMNGVETLREIRKIDHEVPVYLVTAFHKEFLNEIKSTVEAGISCEVLQKPIRAEQIAMVTRSLLQNPEVYE